MSTPTARRRRRPVALLAALVVAVLAAAAFGVFWLGGGRLFVVRTPSMGTAAPVGTLVLTRPVRVADVHVGEIIAFHPPTEPGTTYTHRVADITRDGIATRGDINGARDPWTITGRNLIGRATVVLPGVGWLVKALPYLLVGLVLVWMLTAVWVGPTWRNPARLMGAAFVFLLTALLLHPFVGIVQLSSSSAAGGTSRVSVVSTGLLPVRLTPTVGGGHAAPVDLSLGRTGVSVLHGGTPGGRYHLQTHLHLTPWQWLIVALLCLTPLLYCLVVGFAPVRDELATDATEAPEPVRRPTPTPAVRRPRPVPPRPVAAVPV